MAIATTRQLNPSLSPLSWRALILIEEAAVHDARVEFSAD
jgi:hypothetical protein